MTAVITTEKVMSAATITERALTAVIRKVMMAAAVITESRALRSRSKRLHYQRNFVWHKVPFSLQKLLKLQRKVYL